MSTPIEILKSLEGQTIQSVNLGETEEGDVFSVEIICENGSRVSVSPTTFNYGGQYLIIED